MPMTDGGCFRCAYHEAGSCKSCGLITVPYEEQLKNKEETLASIFYDYVKSGTNLKAIVPSTDLSGSRNRGKVVVSGYVHAPVIGITNDSLVGVEILDCPLHDVQINRIFQESKDLIRNCGIPPYDVAKKQGELKYLVVRYSSSSGEALVRLVMKSTGLLERAKRFAELLQKRLPYVKVISVNVQPVHAAIIEGEEELVLTPQKAIVETIGTKQIVFAPQSFCQVTPNVAAKLYSYVADIVKEASPRKLIDLYCGSGGYSVYCAPYSKTVVGIEMSKGAVESAKETALINHVTNAEFLAGDVEEYLGNISKPEVDAIIVNPPRRGLSPALIEALKRIAPKVIVYSSCNQETLKRDLDMLLSHYQLLSLQPFDMFPLTRHVEVVARLELKSKAGVEDGPDEE